MNVWKLKKEDFLKLKMCVGKCDSYGSNQTCAGKEAAGLCQNICTKIWFPRLEYNQKVQIRSENFKYLRSEWEKVYYL